VTSHSSWPSQLSPPAAEHADALPCCAKIFKNCIAMGIETAIVAGCGVIAAGMIGSAAISAKIFGRSIEKAARSLQRAIENLPARTA